MHDLPSPAPKLDDHSTYSSEANNREREQGGRVPAEEPDINISTVTVAQPDGDIMEGRGDNTEHPSDLITEMATGSVIPPESTIQVGERDITELTSQEDGEPAKGAGNNSSSMFIVGESVALPLGWFPDKLPDIDGAHWEPGP